MVVENLFIS